MPELLPSNKSESSSEPNSGCDFRPLLTFIESLPLDTYRGPYHHAAMSDEEWADIERAMREADR